MRESLIIGYRDRSRTACLLWTRNCHHLERHSRPPSSLRQSASSLEQDHPSWQAKNFPIVDTDCLSQFPDKVLPRLISMILSNDCRRVLPFGQVLARLMRYVLRCWRDKSTGRNWWYTLIDHECRWRLHGLPLEYFRCHYSQTIC
jgi:hypothetical protein